MMYTALAHHCTVLYTAVQVNCTVLKRSGGTFDVRRQDWKGELFHFPKYHLYSDISDMKSKTISYVDTVVVFKNVYRNF